jgi:hypothetical protein
MDSMSQAIAETEALDFDMIKRKLMDPDTGEGWSSDYCDRVCKEYRRFLALRREYPMFTAIVPSSPVDTFWHYHIIDTCIAGISPAGRRSQEPSPYAQSWKGAMSHTSRPPGHLSTLLKDVSKP